MNKKILSAVAILASILIFAGAGCFLKKDQNPPADVPNTGSDKSNSTGQKMTEEEKCIEITAYFLWVYQVTVQKDLVTGEAVSEKMKELLEQYGWDEEKYNEICNKYSEKSDFMTRVGERMTELMTGVKPITPTSTIVIMDPETLIFKYNLDKFRNKKWQGEINQSVEGTVAIGPTMPCRIARAMISVSFTMQIDEMHIDFKNLNWAKRAKELGIKSTAGSSAAVTILGTGKIIFQNPWRLFMTPTDQTVINSNPLPVSFIGYIDFENNTIRPFEQFTNHPIMSETETVCPYYNMEECPLGCMSNSGSQEWNAEKIWLRGMTFEFGPENEIVLLEPIWNMTEFDGQQQIMLLSPLYTKGEVVFDAFGTLKIKK